MSLSLDKNDITARINKISSIEELEKLRIEYIGKKGFLSNEMQSLSLLSIEEKKIKGQELNLFKSFFEQTINNKKSDLEISALNEKLENEQIDATLPPRDFNTGKIHPISQTIYKIIDIFSSMGFSVESGPDIETDFNNFTALNSLNLQINEGEIFCLLGANGAGKTTTINILLGFVSPTSGTASINNLEVTEHTSDIKKYVAYIPEMVSLYPNLSGIENLNFFASLAGFNLPKEELAQLLSKAGLQENAHNKPLSGYSKGMRQKVGIAIALAKKAKVLLLDEPISGLDPKAANEFSEILKDA